MTYKLYQDKSSILKKNSRYLQGGFTEILPNMLGYWDKREDIITEKIDNIKFITTKEFEGRPDKLAYYVYGRHDLTWLILQYNNIVDLTEEFIAGKEIKLPSMARVFTEILTNPIRFQPK